MAADRNMVYSMKIAGFYVILASLGVKNWYGFGVSDTEMPGSCEDVNRLITDLYSSEVISFDNAKMILRDDYADIFDVLKSSEECVYTVRSQGSTKKVLSYFLDDRVVMIEQDDADSSLIRLSLASKSGWSKKIVKDTIDFDGISKESVIIPGDGGKTFSSSSYNTSEAASLPDVIAVFDKIGISTGVKQERLTIRERGLQQFMVLERSDTDEISVMQGGISEAGHFLRKWI